MKRKELCIRMISKIQELQRLFPFMETPFSHRLYPCVNKENRHYTLDRVEDIKKPAKVHPEYIYPSTPTKSNVMVFDVETTGLIPSVIQSNIKGRKSANVQPAPNDTVIPYIIQLSYILYDVTLRKVVKIYNEYIQLPEYTCVSAEITQITGITQEMCDQKGIRIEDALLEFAEDYKTCREIVSHNIDFDRSMIQLEMARHWSLGLSKTVFNVDYSNLHQIEFYCTMAKGLDICNIYKERTSKYKNADGVGKTWKYKKMPKLVELYKELFRATPEHLHNSLIDTLVCMRCYLKMRHDLEIDENNFQKMLKDALV
jgi:DNA polymerase III epsilon subunit-like protein